MRSILCARLWVVVLGIIPASLEGQVSCPSIVDPTKRLACFDSAAAAIVPKSVSPESSGIPDAVQAGSHKYRVTANYDRFKDYTVAMLDGVTLRGSPDVNWQLIMFYIMDGKDIKPPFSSRMMFRTASATWRFLKCSDTALLIDGQRLELRSDHDGSVGDGGVSETITATLNVSDLLRAANAKTVEGKICFSEFSFPPDVITAIRDFASRMKPLAKD